MHGVFLLTFFPVTASGDKPMVEVHVGKDKKIFSPEEISAMVYMNPFLLELRFF